MTELSNPFQMASHTVAPTIRQADFSVTFPLTLRSTRYLSLNSQTNMRKIRVIENAKYIHNENIEYFMESVSLWYLHTSW